MAWIESHQALEKHPKIYDLMNFMAWDLDTTIGKLHRFWWWCVNYAEDGDLRKHNNTRLATAIGVHNEKAEDFVNAMIKSGWIDIKPYLRVHDWWHYFGRFLQVKYKHNPNNWQKIRKLYNNRCKNSPYNHIPKPNQPNQPNLIISPQADGLLKQFSSNLQEKINIYIERNRLKNKSKVITEGRKTTLLTELWNSKERCGDETMFSYALEMSLNYDACNIGYINAIIKNKKAEK